MQCPFCRVQDTKVIDSRLAGEGDEVRRRRECISCAERFTTYETIELSLPRLIKRDGSRVQFREEKLRAGILRALEKRPVQAERVDNSVNRLMHRLCAAGEAEIETSVLGEWVMAELRALDEVAYVRFASVYRRFQDIHEFKKEIDELQHEHDHANENNPSDADVPNNVTEFEKNRETKTDVALKDDRKEAEPNAKVNMIST